MMSSGITALCLGVAVIRCHAIEQFRSHERSLDSALPSDLQLPSIDPALRNPWPAQWEAQFQDRAAAVIQHFAHSEKYGNGYGENEKGSYPRAMFDFLAGNRQKAIAFLQAEDPQAPVHQHTAGIDYYYAFTLKGQIRKYFLFGPYLDADYRQRMWQGAHHWTEQDPLHRPHPRYGKGNGQGRDWDIQRRGGWVDSRNTDNLRAMREVAVYLMAEETGNETVRRIYQQKLRRYVTALYHIGMGEWDSSVYHGHTFAAYLNLYDFAQDQTVKQLAKAALDWMSAAAAVKYYRGAWGGPSKRDYGNSNVVYGSSSARTFWLYFGDNPLPNPAPERDLLHCITSPYRPPAAVVALAQKRFAKPLEILSSKPLYENWKPGYDRSPGYWETSYIGQTFQMGSLAGPFADGDVLPFKLMVQDSRREVEVFAANTGGGKQVHPGKQPGDQIGQFRNLIIWLRPVSRHPFTFQLPQNVVWENEQGIWFLKFEQTWLALHPIALNLNRSPLPPTPKLQRTNPQAQVLNAHMQGDRFAGFALEVGETTTHGSYPRFKQTVKQTSQLDLRQLTQGVVQFQGSQGNMLQLGYHPDHLLPNLQRNGQPHRWREHVALYQSFSPTGRIMTSAPITLGWKRGQLTVQAGGEKFKTFVTSTGQVIPHH